METDRSNHSLNTKIENLIDTWDGTAFGQEIKNMYENGSSYESICDRIGIDYKDFKED